MLSQLDQRETHQGFQSRESGPRLGVREPRNPARKMSPPAQRERRLEARQMGSAPGLQKCGWLLIRESGGVAVR
ncbi:hypothetical protein NDU88_002794 [Pleurodeles waltl]|uniref:Uncharacterized protein n=1 Tax=Pleurodeles waltl TaxID=8319 RepID=A0AAV7UYA5_PLEWA|nr:hypothetical protein NDU88_002794 [Pleurodeles waltl]